MFASLLFLISLFFQTAKADVHRIAVLDFEGSGIDNRVLLSLSDHTRIAALDILPHYKFDIITRENMLLLLEDMGKDKTCLLGECEVEIARKIGADFVVSGDLLSLQGEYALMLKVHDTRTAKLLAGGSIRSVDLWSLIEGTGTHSKDILKRALLLDTSLLLDIGHLQGEGYWKKHDDGDKKINAVADEDAAPKKDAVDPDSMSYLSVQSQIVGLPLYLDGKRIGKTPLLGKAVESGLHELSLDDKCYKAPDYVFLAKPDQKEQIFNYPAQERLAGIDVGLIDQNGNSLRANIYVDGNYYGHTPSTIIAPLCSKNIHLEYNGRLIQRPLELREENVTSIFLSIEAEKYITNKDYSAVFIHAGSFSMGCSIAERDNCSSDEFFSQKVEITTPFYMMQTEVTQSLYQRVMKKNPSHFQDCGGKCPVERISWYDAVIFSNALSESEGLDACYSILGEKIIWNRDCNGWRLPTEAEWEYAAKGGKNERYAGSASLDEVAWYNGNSNRKTHPVCEKKRNGFGLCDINGNVFEWVWDNYAEDYYGSENKDPSGPETGSQRVNRGGSWLSDVDYSYTSNRYHFSPNYRFHTFGFRLVRSQKMKIAALP
ncbi:MAG: SUMF1/EgtB/PvdO family nonheme iron enzyme [Myxococcota bacterium]|nr:SUMF1/EgtB/PvdO family nonheme iron enzyme [Myxococcota bacterium]